MIALIEEQQPSDFRPGESARKHQVCLLMYYFENPVTTSGFFSISPGNMKFGGVLLFTRLENFRRAMACDPEKCFLQCLGHLIGF